MKRAASSATSTGAGSAAGRSCGCSSSKLGRRASRLAGVAFGAATLSHQFGGVVLLAGTIGLLRLFREHGGRRLVAGLGILAIAAATTIVGGYGLLGIRATGSSSPGDLLRWVVGHGHDPTYGRFFTLVGGSVALWCDYAVA